VKTETPVQMPHHQNSILQLNLKKHKKGEKKTDLELPAQAQNTNYRKQKLLIYT
jgi:hypothetical protein